jgi:hypothetical protein
LRAATVSASARLSVSSCLSVARSYTGGKKKNFFPRVKKFLAESKSNSNAPRRIGGLDFFKAPLGSSRLTAIDVRLVAFQCGVIPGLSRRCAGDAVSSPCDQSHLRRRTRTSSSVHD